jgi:putative alpha-1,2-mannosidase
MTYYKEFHLKKEGGKEIFYAGLYHSSIAPNTLNDLDGNYYRSLDNKIHKDTTQNHYTSFSLWDTLRAWNPMMTLSDEKFVSEMINSMLINYQIYYL